MINNTKMRENEKGSKGNARIERGADKAGREEQQEMRESQKREKEKDK